jgi:malonate-semialdehyde dehydrogenase (acetylating)/methylmalonate-semialdehyde dehydrogenase
MTTIAPPNPRLTHYINGRWTDPQSTDLRDVVNPATGEVLAQVPLADAHEVNQAVEAATFPEWRRTPPEDRIQPLFKLKMLLEDHLDSIAASSPRKTARPSPRPKPRCAAPSRTSKSPAAFP